MEVQTRNNEGVLVYFDHAEEAFDYADHKGGTGDSTVWKISWSRSDGTRFRFVRDLPDRKWREEPIQPLIKSKPK